MTAPKPADAEGIARDVDFCLQAGDVDTAMAQLGRLIELLAAPQRYVAIICRQHGSELITIWSRPDSVEDGVAELKRVRETRGDDYVFDLVFL